MTQQPALQLALDVQDLQQALAVTEQVYEAVDIIEVGTLLCLSAGMDAVRQLRARYPEATILGDVRIVRAGGKIAEMVFDAGANWVSVVGEAPVETIAAAAEVARSRGGEVQVELADNWNDTQVMAWRDLGIEQVIYHSTAEVGATGGSVWTPEALKTISSFADMGFKVTVTGGITPDTIPVFAGLPVFVFIAGRAIWAAEDPATAARRFGDVITKTFG